MPIPDRARIRWEILDFLKDKTNCTYRQTLESLSDQFKLSEDERTKRIPSGSKRTFDEIVLWAISELRHAGYLKNVEQQRGIFNITEYGLEELNRTIDKIDNKSLTRSKQYTDWQAKFQVVKKPYRGTEKKITPKEGIIILLDALGIKGIWKRDKSKKVLRKWNDFVRYFEDYITDILKNKNLTPKFDTFGDTIRIIVEVKDTKEIETDLINVAFSLHGPIIRSMIICMPLRGCITTGEYSQGTTLIIGRAIDEAASYYNLPQWVGISASSSANRIIEQMKDYQPGVKDNFFRCDIPLKESIEQNAWALKWPDFSDDMISEDSERLSGHKYSDTLDLINEKLKNPDSLDAALKWRNTAKFYESVLKDDDKL